MPDTPHRSKGDQIDIPASLWNAGMEIVKKHRSVVSGERNVKRHRRVDVGVVEVKNTTAAAYVTYDVMGIDDLALSPVAGGIGKPSLEVVDPVLADHEGAFVVIQEPIAIGGYGLAVVSGITFVKVHWEGVDLPKYAEVADGEEDYLEGSDTEGSAKVLLLDSTEIGVGTDVYWAVVLLGYGATTAGSGADGGFVKITSLGPIMGDWKGFDESAYDNNGTSHFEVTDEGNGYVAVDDVFPGFKWTDETLHIASTYHRAKDV